MNGSNLRTDKTLSISIEQQTESARTGILSANTMVFSSHSTTPNCIFCTHSHEDIVRTGQIASSFIHSLTRKALSHHCYKDTA